MIPQHNLFLTGGTGRIGQFLVASLAEEGFKIKMLCRKKKDFSAPEISMIEGDLSCPDSYSDELRGSETVIHLAAESYARDIGEYYRVNARGTELLIGACRKQGVKRFIHISTWAISEEGGHYSLSKKMAEDHVRESGLDWVILRLSEVYGVSGGKGMDMLLSGVEQYPFVPVIGDGKYKIAPVHVKDVVSVLVKAAASQELGNRTYDIIGPETFTFNELIDKILALKDLKKIKIHLPVSLIKVLVRMITALKKDSPFFVDNIPRLTCEKKGDIAPAKARFGYDPKKLLS